MARALPRLLPGLGATALALLVVATLYGAAIGRVLVTSGGNPLAMARIGRALPAQRFWDQDPPFEEVGPGNDGQFFYYIARDPLLTHGDTAIFDRPAYRYQRILLPVLAYVLGLGNPRLIGWAVPLVNLLAIGLGCWAASRVLRQYRASPWWLVAYGLNPGFLLGVLQDLAEPLALGLVTVGCLAYLRGRHGWATAALALAVLAREPMVAVAGGILLWELAARRDVRRAALFLVPFGVLGAWQLLVWWKLGALPLTDGPGHIGLTFVTMLPTLRKFLGLEPMMLVTDMAPSARLGMALAMLALIAAASVAVVAGVLHRTALGVQLAIQGLFMLSLGADIWDQSLAFARVAMLLFMFYVLVAVEARTTRSVTGAARHRAQSNPARSWWRAEPHRAPLA